MEHPVMTHEGEKAIFDQMTLAQRMLVECKVLIHADGKGFHVYENLYHKVVFKSSVKIDPYEELTTKQEPLFTSTSPVTTVAWLYANGYFCWAYHPSMGTSAAPHDNFGELEAAREVYTRRRLFLIPDENNPQ